MDVKSDRVEFNAPHKTVQVISDAVLTKKNLPSKWLILRRVER